MLKEELNILEKKPTKTKSEERKVKQYKKLIKLIAFYEKQKNDKMLEQLNRLIDQNSTFKRDENDRSVFSVYLPAGVEMKVSKLYKDNFEQKPTLQDVLEQ